MTVRVCLDCTTAFAVGVPRCPHCGSERHAEEGSAAALGIQASVPVELEEDGMPKITRHGGASVAGVEPARVEDGEGVSAGTSSETSSEKPSTKPEPSKTPSPSPARPTGSRSGKGRTGSSSAGSAGGGRAAGTSETGSADEGGAA